MTGVVQKIEEKYKKPHVVDVKSGDSVKVHQKIREGNKERVQIFEGLVIKTARQGSHTSSITVRRVASGVGVEKTYLVHSPLITKIQVVKRSKVRRNYLSYMRARTGKAARLANVDFDQEAVNKIPEPSPAQTSEEVSAGKQPKEETVTDKPEKTEAEKPQDAEKPAEKKASEAQSSTSAKADSAAEEPKAENKPEAKSEAEPEAKKQ